MTSSRYEAGGEGDKSRPRDSAVAMLPKVIPMWQMHMGDALMLVRDGSTVAHEEALRALDSAAGLRAVGGGQAYGATISAAAGCKCLPLYLVRQVEFETLMRRMNWSEMDIALVHGLFSEAWYFGDVCDADAATGYLMRATLSGNRFAKRVLDWLAPERGRGVTTGKGGGREEYLRAIQAGERERAVELGRMGLAGGMLGAVRPDATVLVTMGRSEQRALAANNIGYLLAHGGEGVGKNVSEAVHYYEMAVKLGSAAAASNLGFLAHYGANGAVKRDGIRARGLYEVALERGERNCAPRNLGVLLHHGGAGVRSDVCAAARCYLLGLREGNEAARDKCARSLRLLLRSWRIKLSAPALRRECAVALHAADGEREQHVAAERGVPFGM